MASQHRHSVSGRRSLVHLSDSTRRELFLISLNDKTRVALASVVHRLHAAEAVGVAQEARVVAVMDRAARLVSPGLTMVLPILIARNCNRLGHFVPKNLEEEYGVALSDKHVTAR